MTALFSELAVMRLPPLFDLPTDVRQPPGKLSPRRSLNLGSLDTAGIDLQLDWTMDLADAGLDGNAGSLSLNVVGSYLDSFNVQARPDAPHQDFAGTLGNTTTGIGTFPRWKSTASISYANGPARIGMRWFHVALMKPGRNERTERGASGGQGL